jgi:NADPH2:quinone reductase
VQGVARSRLPPSTGRLADGSGSLLHLLSDRTPVRGEIGQSARIVTTVSTEAKAQVAADAGAPVIVNYRSEGTADRVMQATGGRGVDRISEVDFGGNLRTTLAVMKPSCDIGAYASKGNPEPTLPFYPLLFNNIVVRFIQCHAMPKDLRLCGTRDLAR